MEHEPLANQDSLRLHFWFLVSFSLFLIVTFVYYLPLRFMHDATSGMGHGNTPMQAGGHAGHGATAYHEEKDITDGLAINLNASPVPFMAGTTTRLDFFVNTKPGNVPVPIPSLEIEHEKLMHVIGLRSDMNEFFHIHPVATENPGVMSIEHQFSKPGLYKIWSEVKKDGAIHYFGHEPLNVEGNGPREDKKVTFGRSIVVGGYQVALLADASFGKGVEYDLAFDIHDAEGNEVEVEQYLGADMHLSLIKDDWTQFIHTHPESAHTHAFNTRTLILEARADAGHAAGDPHGSASSDATVNFHVTFPEAGLYRAFGQFRPAGTSLSPDEALTAAFWIRVEEKAPQSMSAAAQWWLLLLVSLAAIAGLSWKVNTYLKKGAQ